MTDRLRGQQEAAAQLIADLRARVAELEAELEQRTTQWEAAKRLTIMQGHHKIQREQAETRLTFALETIHTLGTRLGVLDPSIPCDGPQLLAAMEAYSDHLAEQNNI